MSAPTDPQREAEVDVPSAFITTLGESGVGRFDEDDLFPPPTHDPSDLGRIGHYRVLKRLGKGGMGAVFLAEDSRLRRPVALKIMLPRYAGDPTAKERFLREARAAAKARHDHIVTIYEVGQNRGRPYIAMELLAGLPLDVYLERKGAPPIPHVLRIGREIALGLAAAHRIGLVHRDVKPANVWLESPAGRVKLLDFGLAKVEGEAKKLTADGAVMGTPAYMSPEQAMGRPLDYRSDLFSLGGLLYRLVTGRQPFTGPTVMAILLALASDDPKPIRELNADAPPSLAELIERLLAKDARRRPKSARSVADELNAIARSLKAPASPRLVIEPPSPAESEAGERLAPGGPRRRRRRKTRRWWIPVGAAAAIMVAGVSVGMKLAYHAGGRVEQPKATERTSPTRTLAGHLDSIRGVAFLDSRRAVSAGWDHTVRCWDVAAQTPGKSWGRHAGLVTCLAVSADGRRAATGGSEHDLKVWDAASGRELCELRIDRPAVGSVALDESGSLLLVGTGFETVELWETAAKRKRKSFRAPTVVSALRFLPGGKYFLAGGSGAKAPIVLFDLESSQPIRRFEGHEQNVFGLAPLPDGRRFLSCASDGSLRIWRIEDGKELGRLSDSVGGPNVAYTSLALAPNGRRAVTGGYDGVLRIWNLDSMSLERRIPQDSYCVNYVALSPDGRSVLTGGGGRVEKGKGWSSDGDWNLRLWQLPE